MDPFAAVIDDLGGLIDVPLHLDHRRTCTLSIDHKLHLQLQEQVGSEKILISTFLGEIPPGAFREIALKAALKENALPSRLGVLCYSARNHQLALFTEISLRGLRGDLLADVLERFLEKAFLWKNGLQSGVLPLTDLSSGKSGPSIFEVRPKA